MVKILIGGPSPSATNNRGDEAVFSNFCQGMRKHFPDCQITAMVRHPSERFDRLFGVKSIRNFDHDNRRQSLGRWFHGFNPGDSTEQLKNIREAVEEADIIVVGGSPFEEISPNSFLRGEGAYAALLATLAIMFQKPFAVYAMQQCPIKSEFTANMARFVCNNARIVTVREEYSQTQLLEVGVQSSHVYVLADPAFGVEPCQSLERGQEILKREEIPVDQAPFVGVNFRHLYWIWDEQIFEKRITKMASLCDFIISEWNRSVLFIPNQCYRVDTPIQDDRWVAEKIWQKLKYSEHAFLIRREYTLPDTLAIYPYLEFMISNRRHACIFAAIHTVPAVALCDGNDWNFLPFLQQMSLQDHLLDFSSDLAQIQNQFETLYSLKKRTIKILQEKVPKLKSKAHKHTELIADIL